MERVRGAFARNSKLFLPKTLLMVHTIAAAQRLAPLCSFRAWKIILLCVSSNLQSLRVRALPVVVPCLRVRRRPGRPPKKGPPAHLGRARCAAVQAAAQRRTIFRDLDADSLAAILMQLSDYDVHMFGLTCRSAARLAADARRSRREAHEAQLKARAAKAKRERDEKRAQRVEAKRAHNTEMAALVGCVVRVGFDAQGV